MTKNLNKRKDKKKMTIFVSSMYEKMKDIIAFSLLLFLITACVGNKRSASKEDFEAKQEIQGVWVDDDTESPLIQIKGDTLYYSDAGTVPVAFKIISDTLYTYGDDTAAYKIEKRMPNTLWLHSQTGEELHLSRSEEDDNLKAFQHGKIDMPVYTQQVKHDSVVIYRDVRYRAYTYINPSKKKVICSSISEDGFQVDKVYYDNIMHICVYQGAKCLYSSDIAKHIFASMVPSNFLENAVLSNMRFCNVSKNGFCYEATLQQPESSIMSVIDLYVSFEGKLTMKNVGH